MNRTFRMRHVFLCSALLLSCSPTAGADKPNILFIIADDIGYGDLGRHGAKLVKTPVLDKLATEGCRLADAHSPASTCMPTRRAFLTGTYSRRQQPGSAIAPGDAPLSIPPGTATVASLFKQGGYKTGAVGKWPYGKAKGAKANVKAPPPKPQLFNLADDPAEANDFSAKMPDKMKEFSDLITKAREAGRTRS
jgi:hypothetical protein